MNEIASRYGLALFEIAKERNMVKELQNEGHDLYEILLANKEFITILESGFTPLKERLSLVDKTFVGVDDDILSWLKILIRNNRARFIISSLEAFNSFCNEYLGILEGLVYSPFKLDKELIQKLENKISLLENKQVYLINHIDSTLIGGVKVVINSHIYDGSIKNTIEGMQKDLLYKRRTK